MTRDLSRLKELVEVVLPSVPDVSFDLRKWKHHCKSECKTVFCACGWAALHPPFQQAGLRLLEEFDGVQLVYETEELEECGYEAVTAFFSIELEEAYYFFNPSDYENGTATTKQQVIDRITQFLIKNQAKF